MFPYQINIGIRKNIYQKSRNFLQMSRRIEMVSRNFSQLESAYSRMMHVSDDDREYLNLEELKPHHLTELSNPLRHTLQLNANSPSQTERGHRQSQHQADYSVGESGQIYYDLNAHPNSE